MTPRYFIWRLTDREPWRVYSVLQWFPCSGEYAEWRGDDYQAALEECRKLNQERKGAR